MAWRGMRLGAWMGGYPGVCVGLYKIFVCAFGDCALVNTFLGIQHLLYYNPPHGVFRDQYCAIYGPPPAPRGLPINIQYC